MKSYLKQLAKQIAREAGDRLQDYTFVFPNRRAGLFFRHHLAGEMHKPIWAPEIITINDCFAQLSPLHTADQLTLLIRLYHTYCRVIHEEPLGDWLYWGRMLLQDFSEVDNHLTPNVKELFTTIRDLKMIDQQFGYLSDRQREAISSFWGDVRPKDRQTTEHFMQLWDCLWPMYDTFRQQLLADGLAYEGLLHRHLIEHWDELAPQRMKSHYVFVGFNALTASEEQLMIRLREAGRAEFHFDYSDRKVADPENRTSLFIEHNKQLFGLTDIGTATEDTEKNIRLISVPSTTGEAHEVWRVLNEMFPADQPHESYTRTAVVLPDERMLLPILSSIPEQIDKVNVTMGYPLRTTPAYALVGLLRQLLQRRTEAGFYHTDVVNILNHRFIRQYAAEEAQALLMQIEQQNLIYVPGKAIPDQPLLQAIFLSAKLTTQTIDYLRDILLLVSEDTTEELFTIPTALNQIEQTLRTYPVVIQPQELFLLIELLLDDRTIPYAGEPLEGLQIMGVLETRALDFDRLIITGFNDDLYPGTSTGHSFIPYTLRRGFGLPTPERQDAIFAYNFYRMLSYAREVVFICNADTENHGEPSRYLAQLRYQYGMTIHHETVQPDNTTTPSQPITIHKDEHVLQQLSDYVNPQGRQGFSASALNDYLKCPALFYWGRVAGIKPPKEVSEETDDLTIGNVFHAIMEHLYAPYQGQEITSDRIRQFQSQIDAHWPALPELENVREDMLALTVLRRYVDQQLERDLGRTPFRYLHAEMPCHDTFTLEDGRQVRLTGKIDRVEEKDGVIRLIDYKTGKGETVYENIPSLFDPNSKNRNKQALQTILYTLLYPNPSDHPVVPHIYSQRMAADEPTEVRQKGHEHFDLDEIKSDFKKGLDGLIKEILSPDQDFVAKTEGFRQCDNCNFYSLCH